MNYRYQIIRDIEIKKNHQKILEDLLKLQGKIKPPYHQKAHRCKFICIVFKDESPIGLGAIKFKTPSDFLPNKADLPHLAEKFEWELGYIFVRKEFEQQGIATTIVASLLERYGSGNIMASTEITANPGMVRILERYGFKHSGKTWQSERHSNLLGLFLRFG